MKIKHVSRSRSDGPTRPSGVLRSRDCGPAYRILDANFNRSREGLRVCEDVVRFVIGSKALTQQLKVCRHAISDVLKKMGHHHPEILESRDVRGDVGKGALAIENPRVNFLALFSANSQRVKESLRVLEETVKLLEPQHAKKFKTTRFRIYAIEKKVLPKLETLCDHLPRISRRPFAKTTRARGASRRRRRGSAA